MATDGVHGLHGITAPAAAETGALPVRPPRADLSNPMTGPIPALVRRVFGRVRYPRLLALTATLFVADLFVPDLIPFADEVLLGLGTLLLTQLRRRHTDNTGAAP